MVNFWPWFDGYEGFCDYKYEILKDLLINNFNDIKNKKIGLMIVTDEELGGEFGVNYLVNEIGYRGKVVLVPNDGEKINQIVSHSKNIIALEFTAKGVEAHVCRPWDGVNAIEKNIQVYNNIRKHFLLLMDWLGVSE